MIKNFFKKWWKKSWFSRITDVVFILLVITLLVPEGRLAVGGFVNKLKSQLSQPGLLDQAVTTEDSDWDWPMVDANGDEFNLMEAKGKVVFLNLWATWCPPCVGEMPEIQEMYDRFRDHPQVAFILVSSEPLDKVNAFVEKKKYDFPVYSSQSSPTRAFGTKSIPTSFLIAPDGKVVIREVGAMNWGGKKMAGMINDLLSE